MDFIGTVRKHQATGLGKFSVAPEIALRFGKTLCEVERGVKQCVKRIEEIEIKYALVLKATDNHQMYQPLPRH